MCPLSAVFGRRVDVIYVDTTICRKCPVEGKQLHTNRQADQRLIKGVCERESERRRGLSEIGLGTAKSGSN